MKMKKYFLAAALAVIAMITFAACRKAEEGVLQATVEAEAQVEQIEMMQTAETEEQPVPVQKETIAEILGIPAGNYVWEGGLKEVDTDRQVQVYANAEIVVPEIDKLPIARVAWRSFTEQDVEQAYEAFMKESMPVEEGGIWPKFYYQRILDGLLEQKRLGRLDKYETMDDLDDAIREVEAQVAAAPEEVTPFTPDMSFDENGIARILSLWDNNDASDLMVNNFSDGRGDDVYYLRDMFNRTEFARQIAAGDGPTSIYTLVAAQEATVNPPKVSAQEALATAKQAITDLGLEDFVYAGNRLAPLFDRLDSESDSIDSSAYEFFFVRQVNGVGMTYTNDVSALAPSTDASGSMPWMYERVRIFVDDDGIYACIWAGPSSVTEILDSDADLLPFEEIAYLFEDTITQKFAEHFGETVEKIEVHINRVQLGLARVTEDGNKDGGLLIPVWDFFGWYDEGHGYPMGLDGYESLLTINAIDGSIVDRSRGY